LIKTKKELAAPATELQEQLRRHQLSDEQIELIRSNQLHLATSTELLNPDSRAMNRSLLLFTNRYSRRFARISFEIQDEIRRLPTPQGVNLSLRLKQPILQSVRILNPLPVIINLNGHGELYGIPPAVFHRDCIKQITFLFDLNMDPIGSTSAARKKEDRQHNQDQLAHRGIVWVFSHCPPLDFALKTDGYRTLTA
jgi:hypothetical protein